MKKKEVRECIYALLLPLFVKSGFDLKKGADGGFRRVIADGRQEVAVALVDHAPVFKFSLVTTIRLDAVEDIANRFNTAPEKYHALTTTCSFRFEKFADGPASFEVTSRDEIIAAVDQLRTAIHGRLLPFLDATTDLAAVAKAMNLTEIPSIPPGGPDKRALTVARLVKHPQFETIAATWQERLSQYPPAAQEDLAKFIQFLRESC